MTLPTALWTDIALGSLACIILLSESLLGPRLRKAIVFHGAWIGLVLIGILTVCTAPESEQAIGNYLIRPWTIPFRLCFCIAGALSVLLSRNLLSGTGHTHRRGLLVSGGVHIFLIICSTLGMFVVTGAQDLITFLVGIELATIPLYVQAAMLRDDFSSEASAKYLIIGSLSTAFTVFGISYLYGAGNSVHFDTLAQTLTADKHFAWVGVIFVLAGIGFKLSAAPFHMWAPDIYDGAPPPVTAYIASSSKAAGLAGLILLVYGPFQQLGADLENIFMFLAIISMTIGNLGALRQKRFNRFMAWSSVAQIGFVLMALTGGDLAIPSIAFYLLVYIIGNFIAFFVVNCLASNRPETFSNMRGLSKQSPLLALCLLISMFSLAGIPPLGGFFGKFELFLAAAQPGHEHFYLILFAAINAVVSLYYYMIVVKDIYITEPTHADNSTCPAIAILPSQRLTLVVLVIAIIVLGVWPAAHSWIFTLAGS